MCMKINLGKIPIQNKPTISSCMFCYFCGNHLTLHFFPAFSVPKMGLSVNIVVTVLWIQVTSPMKKPTSVRTPTGREGLGVGDTSQLSSGATEEEYAVVDCESSVTALEMVQLRMDKHGKTLGGELSLSANTPSL